MPQDEPASPPAAEAQVRELARRVLELEKEVAFLKERGVSEEEQDIVLGGQPRNSRALLWNFFTAAWLIALSLLLGWSLFLLLQGRTEPPRHEETELSRQPFVLP